MNRLPRKFDDPSRDFDMQFGTSSAVLSRGFVAESLRRGYQDDDELNAVRGAVNALLISLVFWISLGAVLFAFS